jgi:hypothetical protein
MSRATAAVGIPDNASDLPNGAGKPLPSGSVLQALIIITINNKDHRPNKPVLSIIRAALSF